jgi:ankyrin repeat protein
MLMTKMASMFCPFLHRPHYDVSTHLCLTYLDRTPLHIAVSRAEDYNISRVLIENGADLENRSIDGRTPLHTFFNKVVKKILLYHGDEINEASADSQGMTLLHFVAWSSKSDSEIFKRCMERTGGATSIWLNDNERRSILHFAAQRGNAAILQCVLSLCQQLDVTHKDQSGRTTLHYAVESKRSAVIDIICAHGGAIRGTDDRGRTVLHHAALRGNLVAVEKLIELGAANDMYSEDKDGKTPTQLASQRGATTVVEYLTELQSRIVRKNTAKNDPSMDSSIHEGLGPRGSWRLRGRFVPKRKFSGVSVNFAFTLLAATLLWHCVRIFIWAPIR